MTEYFINIKLIGLICGALIILYYILMLYLINKLSKKKNKLILSKYIPSFIQNQILFFYDISQFEQPQKEIILSNIKKTFKFISIMYALTIIISSITIY